MRRMWRAKCPSLMKSQSTACPASAGDACLPTAPPRTHPPSPAARPGNPERRAGNITALKLPPKITTPGAVQSLQGRHRPPRVAILAVVIVFENQHARFARPFQQRETAPQAHRHAQRELVCRSHIDEFRTWPAPRSIAPDPVPRRRRALRRFSLPPPATQPPLPDTPAPPSTPARRDSSSSRAVRSSPSCAPETISTCSAEHSLRAKCSGIRRPLRAAVGIPAFRRPRAGCGDARRNRRDATCAHSAVGKESSAGWFARNARTGCAGASTETAADVSHRPKAKCAGGASGAS